MAGKLVQLTVPIQRIGNPFTLIEEMATGNSVLNVGAAGGVHGYLPDARETWLHERIARKAASVTGIDIDTAGIDYAAEHGYLLIDANCETMQLDTRFELIVMSDVIEHVDAPLAAVANLLAHLKPDGRLVITTPNGTAGNVTLRTMLRRKINVLAEHVAIYYPEHFQVICNRLDCRLQAVCMFDHIDQRSGTTLLKSYGFRVMTRLSPRLASSMLIVISK